MYDAKTNPRGRRPAAFFLAILLALSLSLAPAWAAEGEKQVIPLGRAVGIKLFSSGVLVVDLSAVTGESGEKSPAKSCGLKEGDVIVSAAGSELRSTEQLQELLQQGAGETLELQVRRGGQLLTMQAEPVLCGDGVCRLGAWIRDSMAGIGTVTFYDPQTGAFAALGHGITDVDTGKLMPLSRGSVMAASVKAVKRGASGSPGELRGDFDLTRDLGSLYANTECGIFGVLPEENRPEAVGEAIPVARRTEVRTGKAVILANCRGDEVCAYEIEIEKLYGGSAPTRNLLLRVTDPALIALTGGIVQGMSGSPIVQDGKLVGAVTHVLLDDPQRGYGILAENMLSASGMTAQSAASA